MNKWLDSVALRILANIQEYNFLNIQERKSISFYSKKLNISGASVNKAIHELHEKGLIKRIKKGREIQIGLTEIGKVAKEQIWSLNRLLG